MSNRATLATILKENNYVVTRKQLTNLNFSGQQIKSYLQNKELVLLDKGIYGGSTRLEDPFYIVQLRLKKGIISLSSALYLYGLSDRVPDKIDLTFPRGYNNSSIKREINFHTQKKDIYKLGITLVDTPQSNNVRAYSVDRTIAEVLKTANHVDSEIINSAIKQYLRLPNKNLAMLMYFAKIFGTTKKVQNYLEILL